MRQATLAFAITVVLIVAGCGDETTPVGTRKVDTLASVASPCEDADAERVALTLSKQLLAPQWLYDRVHSDLLRIRTTYADSIPGVMSVHLSEPGHFDAKIDTILLNFRDSTSCRQFDSLRAVFDLSATPIEYTGDWIILRSGKRYYTPELLVPFTSVPGIIILNNVEVFFDGQDMYVLRDGPDIKYFFMVGSGDCQAGCMRHRYSYFVSERGECRLVGYTAWTSTDDWVTPTWMDTLQLAICNKTPQVIWRVDSGWQYFRSLCDSTEAP